MNERSLREALEACRSGSDDLSLPEMADLAREAANSTEWRDALKSVQRVDITISRALRDVAIPEGLEARLLAAVAAAENAATSQTRLAEIDNPNASVLGTSTPVGEVVPGARTGYSRRTWATLVVTTAATLLAAAWGIQQSRWAPRLDSENLGFEALAWSQNLTDDWLDMSEPRGVNRPIDRQVRFVPRGWQALATNHDAETVVYDLTRPRGKAMLFVLSPAVISETVSKSATRVPATGGWGAATWKSGNYVYVLLVEERRQKLDDYLASPAATEIVVVPLLRTEPHSA